MGETDWVPGLVAVGIAAAFGIVLALRLRGGPKIAGLTRGTDLARQRDALYQQIRELDVGRAQMEPADYAAERRRLELEAANTLMAMAVAAPPPPTSRAPTWGDRHPKLVGLLWGLGMAGFAGGVYFTLPTTEGAPASGEARMASALADLKSRAEANLTDNQAQLDYAKALLGTGNAMEAFQVAKRVTDRDPENPTARTYQAAVLIEMGDLDMAAKAFDKILEGHPNHVDATAYRGLVYYMRGERAEAATWWERVIALDPGKAGEFNPLIQMARGAPVPSGGAPGGGAPGGGATGSASPPEAHRDAADDVVGRIELPSGAPPSGGVLFLYARPNGVTAGPPAAARRFAAPTLPLEFRIGPNDSPMGGPFPDTMTLSARWDGDGNPTTRDPGDYEARVDGVVKAQTGVVLSLARPP